MSSKYATLILVALCLLFKIQTATAQEKTNTWGPDYLIIGAQKSGTTTLSLNIQQHPLVAKEKSREVHFFDLNFHKGARWYRDHLPTRPSKEYLVGDKSPYYFYHPFAPKRVYTLFPSVKIILVLRNPVDRAYSHYWHNRGAKDRELLSFVEAIAAEKTRLQEEGNLIQNDPLYESEHHRNFSYLNRGIYVDQMKSWLEYFSRDQMLILSFEELVKFPQQTLDKVFSFLDLPPYKLTKFAHGKGGKKYPKMDQKLYQELEDHFYPYNQELEELLQMQFNW